MQGGDDDLSIQQLSSNLSTYKQQLQQIRRLLHDDPRNSEYEDMEKELAEVIGLTEELLETAKQSEKSGLSFSGDADAVWSEDGEWYNAIIEALTPNGYFVTYDGWGNKEEVDPANVRPLQEGEVDALLEAEKEAEATKLALKRKISQAATAGSGFQSRSLPPKMRIEPEDPEDVKATKRKKIHAFKGKMRKEQLEVTQNKRQNAWQQFQTTKGRAKKIGFFSGRKRESIFKSSPDDPFGKVGVIGSGKGLTEFQRREKHLHLKGWNAEGMAE